ncbi:MAG: hypothetical protein HKM07_07550 [Chlamydiae bacterium]|nr:hypothetical protein [Chlamydiota bacterium]
MKKAISTFMILALVTTTLRASDVTPVPKEPREVSKAPKEIYNAGKAKQWQNIFLAIGVVTVAVVTCLIVANHYDHHKHHHHHDHKK